jgi:hypothetical protein
MGEGKYFAFFHSFIKVDRYACIFMTYSASLKSIGIVNLMTLFAYTLFAFAIALLALLALFEFAAFSLFVRSPEYALACSRVCIFGDPVRFLLCARDGTLSMGGAMW